MAAVVPHIVMSTIEKTVIPDPRRSSFPDMAPRVTSEHSDRYRRIWRDQGRSDRKRRAKKNTSMAHQLARHPMGSEPQQLVPSKALSQSPAFKEKLI
jgi:hypothetical protein